MGKDKHQEPDDSWAMRADEVCRKLRIGRNTLYSWCDENLIPHKRVGRVILFSRRGLREWLESRDDVGGT